MRPLEGDPEAGSTTPLIVGMFVIVAVFILGSITVTSAHLARIKLMDAADGAALAAASAADSRVYRDGAKSGVTLNDATVRAAAAEYLDQRGLPPGIDDWALTSGTGTPDGQVAVVGLTGRARLPVLSSLLSELGADLTITVTARARAPIVTI